MQSCAVTGVLPTPHLVLGNENCSGSALAVIQFGTAFILSSGSPIVLVL